MNLVSRILLSFLLLCSHAGFGYTIHYCKGSVAFVSSVFSNKQDCSSSCHPEIIEPITCCQAHQVESEETCCKDHLIQVDTDELGEYGTSFSSFFMGSNRTDYTFIHVSDIVVTRLLFTSVVQTNGPPLYKLYHQFLFYDKA